MTFERDKIGGNNPPFDPAEIVNLEQLPAQLRETYAFKFDRVKKLVEAANVWLLSFPTITQPEDAANATDRLAQIKAEIDACHGKPTSIHTVAKEPFLKGGRIVDAVLNVELADPLRKAAEALSKPLLAYHQRVRDEEARRAREERERLQKEAEEAAARAAAVAVTEEDLEAAMEAEQAAREAVEAPQAKPALVRGDYGTSSGLRGKWYAKILDDTKIPRAYMMPNLDMINAAGKQKDKDGRPIQNIPGVEWVFQTTLATRK